MAKCKALMGSAVKGLIFKERNESAYSRFWNCRFSLLVFVI